MCGTFQLVKKQMKDYHGNLSLLIYFRLAQLFQKQLFLRNQPSQPNTLDRYILLVFTVKVVKTLQAFFMTWWLTHRQNTGLRTGRKRLAKAELLRVLKCQICKTWKSIIVGHRKKIQAITQKMSIRCTLMWLMVFKVQIEYLWVSKKS